MQKIKGIISSAAIIAGFLFSGIMTSPAVVKNWDGASPTDCSTGGATTAAGWGTSMNWCPNGVPTLNDDIVFNNFYLDIYATNMGASSFQVRSITFEDNFTPGNTMILQNGAGSSRTLRIGNSTTPVQPVIALNTTSGTVSLKQIGSAGNVLLVSLMTDGEFYINSGATLDVESTISGAFGLRKTGAGTLVLSGAHTYTGGTVVSNGTLQVYTLFNSSGAFSAMDGTVFAVKAADTATPLNTSALTLGSAGGGVTCELDLGASGSRSVPLVQATNLTTSGAVTLNLKGTGYSIDSEVPLISFVGGIGGDGFAAFQLGALPDNVGGTLVSNANSIAFLVTNAPVVQWTGSIDGNWDFSTANWFDPSASAATLYNEGVGVRFEDSAAIKSVNIAQDVTPGGITVSNTVDYDFSGPGKISGAFFKKQGSGTVTLANWVANDYSGNTTVSGTLKLGLDNVIPGAVGKGSVFLDGTLDLNSFNQSLGALNGSGAIVNTGGASITLSVGGNNADGAFTGSINESGGNLVLTKTGNGTQLLGANNVYSGGTILAGGLLQVSADNSLGSGTISVTGSAAGVAADASPRTLTNDLSLTTQTTFNTVSSGQLTLTGPVNFNGANRFVNVEGVVVMTGDQSNGSIQKRGNGTLVIKGVCNWSNAAELRSGVTIFDGATVESSSPIRPNSNIAGGTSRMIVTNGASLILHLTTANVRAGWDGDTTATNYLDIAGMIRTPDAIPVNGGVAMGPSPGIITLLPGGDIEAYTIRIEAGAVFSSFNFDGGILRARADNASFCQGLSEAYIRSRGANIDTAGWNISIAQSLLDGGGNGGMVKTGAGTLLLNGASTYTGSTVVSNGGFGGTGTIVGPVTITSAATLTPGVTIGTLTINNALNLEGTTEMDLTRDNGFAESDLVSGITTVTYGGSLVLTNAGAVPLELNDVFQLFSAGTYNGGFASVTPPAGYTIDTNNLAIDGTVKVTGVPAGEQPEFSGFTKLGDGTFQLTFSGVEGQSYRIWATTNIALTPIVDTWTQVSSGTFGTDAVQFIDSDATNNPTRFYTISVP